MDRSLKLQIVNSTLMCCALICIIAFNAVLIGWIFIAIQMVVCYFQLFPDKKIPWFESENRFSFKKWWVEGNKAAARKKFEKKTNRVARKVSKILRKKSTE